MKELSIEEKAKAYDEALKKSKRLYEQGTITESLCYVFPELKESEDERIKKELIGFLKEEEAKADITSKRSETLCKYIVWLEKQYQTFTKKDVDDAYLKGICNTKQELEKQGEQKSVIKMKTPEESLGIDSDTYNKIVDECIYGEQKPAWSEEDNIHLTNAILAAEKEWGSESYTSKWLKSLKDRYTWNPNEEQIEALESATENCACSEYQDCLRELIRQLKKLKEK